MSSGNHLDQLAPDDERARARTAGQTLKRRLENIELRWLTIAHEKEKTSTN